MTKHSILIIGCGSIGERHLRCFVQSGRGAVTACDSNPALLQRMASTYKVDTATDWQSAIASGKYTAAVVCTPAPLHIPMGTELLRRGLHVLIEKPLALSLQNVGDLIAAREASGRKAAVAYVYHVISYLCAAREAVRSGVIGPVLHASAVSGQPFHLRRPAYASTYYNRHETGGGAIQDALTHIANWMESLVGPTDSVLCDCAHMALPGVTVEDTVHVAARHGAVLVGYLMNQFQAPDETTLQLDAAGGSIKIEFHRQRWGVLREGATEWTWHETPVRDRDAHFAAQANAFLDEIEGGTPRLCTLEQAAQTIRFNLAALASAEKGARVFCRDLHG